MIIKYANKDEKNSTKEKEIKYVNKVVITYAKMLELYFIDYTYDERCDNKGIHTLILKDDEYFSIIEDD